MRHILSTPYRKVFSLLLGLSVGLLLILGEVSWSAPDQISPQALMAQIESASAPLILDVRSPAEYVRGHIPQAINIPYREISERLDEITADRADEIVVYCEMGVRASIAERALEQAGFQQVVTLTGDIRAWRQADMPLVEQPTSRSAIP